MNTADIVSLVKIFPQRRQHSATQDRQQRFGEDDERTPLDFLTGSTVLLAPGRYEFGEVKGDKPSFS